MAVKIADLFVNIGGNLKGLTNTLNRVEGRLKVFGDRFNELLYLFRMRVGDDLLDVIGIRLVNGAKFAQFAEIDVGGQGMRPIIADGGPGIDTPFRR